MQLRPAHESDGDAIVAIFRAARAAALSFLPILHTDAEDRAVFGRLVAAGATTVAVEDERLLGFLVLGAHSVEHLYVDPSAWRRGVGGRLLRDAQARRPGGLELWVFQRNHPAIAFYASHAFTITQTTTGTGNEEGEPDARMVWPGR